MILYRPGAITAEQTARGRWTSRNLSRPSARRIPTTRCAALARRRPAPLRTPRTADFARGFFARTGATCRRSAPTTSSRTRRRDASSRNSRSRDRAALSKCCDFSLGTLGFASRARPCSLCGIAHPRRGGLCHHPVPATARGRLGRRSARSPQKGRSLRRAVADPEREDSTRP